MSNTSLVFAHATNYKLSITTTLVAGTLIYVKSQFSHDRLDVNKFGAPLFWSIPLHKKSIQPALQINLDPSPTYMVDYYAHKSCVIVFPIQDTQAKPHTCDWLFIQQLKHHINNNLSI